jgi:hypothetical protein
LGIKQPALWRMVWNYMFCGRKQTCCGEPYDNCHFNQFRPELDIEQCANIYLGIGRLVGRRQQIGGCGLQRPDLHSRVHPAFINREPVRDQSDRCMACDRDWFSIAAEFRLDRQWVEVHHEFGVDQ